MIRRSLDLLTAVLTALVLLCTAAAPAAAGSVTIKNCRAGSVFFKAFDSTDGFKLIAASEGCVKSGQSITLKCATGSCALTANWNKCETWQPYPIGTHSGSRVWAGNCIYNGQVSGCMKSGSECP